MKKLIYLLSVVLAFFSCKPRTSADKIKAGEAGKVAEITGYEYKLDPTSSIIRWRGTKPGGEHYGTVKVTEGKISVEENIITSGKFTIDLNTIVNEDLADKNFNDKLVGHLKSKDFFFVEEYPLAYFEIVSVEKTPDVQGHVEGQHAITHNVTGNLTIRGITKSITFPAQIDISDEKVKAVTNPFAIDRTQWNVSFISKSVFAEFKDNFIDDNMIIQLELEFVERGK